MAVEVVETPACLSSTGLLHLQPQSLHPRRWGVHICTLYTPGVSITPCAGLNLRIAVHYTTSGCIETPICRLPTLELPALPAPARLDYHRTWGGRRGAGTCAASATPCCAALRSSVFVVAPPIRLRSAGVISGAYSPPPGWVRCTWRRGAGPAVFLGALPGHGSWIDVRGPAHTLGTCVGITRATEELTMSEFLLTDYPEPFFNTATCRYLYGLGLLARCMLDGSCTAIAAGSLKLEYSHRTCMQEPLSIQDSKMCNKLSST